MIVTIVTDNINSWFINYGKKLEKKLRQKNHQVEYVFNKNDFLDKRRSKIERR